MIVPPQDLEDYLSLDETFQVIRELALIAKYKYSYLFVPKKSPKLLIYPPQEIQLKVLECINL